MPQSEEAVLSFAKQKLQSVAFLKKDLRRLAAALNDDESLLTLASCTAVGKELVGQGTRPAVLAATEDRLLLCTGGQSTGCLEFSYSGISGLTSSKKELEFDHDGRHVRVKGITPKERTAEFVAAINGEPLEAPVVAPPAPIAVETPPAPTTPAKKPGSKAKKVLGWTVLGLVVLAIVGNVFGSEDDEEKAPTVAVVESAAPTPSPTPSPTPTRSPTPTPRPSKTKPEPKPVVVSSTCTDPPGDIEDGNYESDPSPPPGMDLTKVSIKTGAGGTVVTYESTTPAVNRTPPGVDRLYWNVSFPDGGQLLAKLVNADWTIAQFDLNEGQFNFDIEPKIEGTKMTIVYPVSFAEPFKWGSNTEYGATNYQDFCPEDYGTLRHGA